VGSRQRVPDRMGRSAVRGRLAQADSSYPLARSPINFDVRVSGAVAPVRRAPLRDRSWRPSRCR
jgi:hypothetical protein